MNATVCVRLLFCPLHHHIPVTWLCLTHFPRSSTPWALGPVGPHLTDRILHFPGGVIGCGDKYFNVVDKPFFVKHFGWLMDVQRVYWNQALEGKRTPSTLIIVTINNTFSNIIKNYIKLNVVRNEFRELLKVWTIIHDLYALLLKLKRLQFGGH